MKEPPERDGENITRADLEVAVEALSQRFEVANRTLRQEVLDHFDTAVENIVEEMRGQITTCSK